MATMATTMLASLIVIAIVLLLTIRLIGFVWLSALLFRGGGLTVDIPWVFPFIISKAILIHISIAIAAINNIVIGTSITSAASIMLTATATAVLINIILTATATTITIINIIHAASIRAMLMMAIIIIVIAMTIIAIASIIAIINTNVTIITP